MAQHITSQPLYWNMSPTTTHSTPCASVPDLCRRRSSVRQGTISSLVKDVRVNDPVEIIKKQKKKKEMQQQERAAAAAINAVSVLQRRHSLVNLNGNKSATLRQLNNNNSKTLHHRTMSSTDLMIVSPLKDNLAHQEEEREDKVRLDEEQHLLRKCESYPKQQQQQQQHNNNKQVSPLTSPSCSTTSSCSSISCSSLLVKRPPFIKQQQQQSDHLLFHTTTVSIFHNNNNNNKEQEVILDELKRNMSEYTNDINSLSFNISSHQQSTLALLYEDEDEDDEQEEQQLTIKRKIHECQSLVLQQQELLNKLLASVIVVTQEQPPPPPKPIPKKQQQQGLFSVLTQQFIKGGGYLITKKYPKPITTGIVIKQTKDKKLENTIFIVNGICTTIESCLIPDRLLHNNKKDTIMTSFSDHQRKSIYQQHTYSISITYKDKETQFKLLSKSVWQKDNTTKQCSFKNCTCQFNMFIRRHHCRSCGNIYCYLHSRNRLPLFKAQQDKVPIFSRVCDGCFYKVASNNSLSSL